MTTSYLFGKVPRRIGGACWARNSSTKTIWMHYFLGSESPEDGCSREPKSKSLCDADSRRHRLRHRLLRRRGVRERSIEQSAWHPRELQYSLLAPQYRVGSTEVVASPLGRQRLSH